MDGAKGGFKVEKTEITYSNFVMCNGKPVNIEDLTVQEQVEIGNWLRRTPLESLGLGKVKEVQGIKTA